MRYKKEKPKIKRVQVSFTEEQLSLIHKFKGLMGSDDAEIVRNIVIAWLSEKSLISSTAKATLNNPINEDNSKKVG